MTDKLYTADASKVTASEFARAFRPRISPAEARLALKFAEAFNLPINPEWPEIAKEDQLTECDGDPLLKHDRRKVA